MAGAIGDLYVMRCRPDGSLINNELVHTLSFSGTKPWARHHGACVTPRGYFCWTEEGNTSLVGAPNFRQIRHDGLGNYSEISSDPIAAGATTRFSLTFNGRDFLTLVDKRDYIESYGWDGGTAHSRYLLTMNSSKKKGIAWDGRNILIVEDPSGTPTLEFWTVKTDRILDLNNSFSIVSDIDGVAFDGRNIMLAKLDGSNIDAYFYRPGGQQMYNVSNSISPAGTAYIVGADFDGRNWLVFWSDRRNQ